MGCSLDKSVAEELVIAYAARTLDPAAEADYERHLSLCASCRELADQQRTVWSALEEWRALPVSPDFDRKLAERIARHQESGSWRRLLAGWTWRPLVPVAAACAVLIFAFLLKDNDRDGAPAPETHSRVQIEQQVEHALDDMDMLKEIGVDVSAGPSRSSQKI